LKLARSSGTSFFSYSPAETDMVQYFSVPKTSEITLFLRFSRYHCFPPRLATNLPPSFLLLLKRDAGFAKFEKTVPLFLRPEDCWISLFFTLYYAHMSPLSLGGISPSMQDSFFPSHDVRRQGWRLSMRGRTILSTPLSEQRDEVSLVRTPSNLILLW